MLSVGDERLPFWFFSDPRDIALGLSTDGFGPFKHRTKTAWPIILFNYNLPPEVRFQKDNIISVGVIPGPKKPCDFDSFLWPLVQELLQLAIGVQAFDALSRTSFLLRAYLILVFGDIPAVAMIMRMKGHNAKLPCRMCEIQGIRNDTSKTYYVPLNRDNFASASPRQYDPSALPLRSHETFIQQAEAVQNAPTATASDRLATQYGVKGIPLLSSLTSLSFPASFPYDFMHLIWANLIPNLILLWTGKFKDLEHQDEDYLLLKSAWEAVGAATAAAGDTVPASFGARPPNLASDGSHVTAEMRSIWTMFFAPTLLRRRFQKPRFYKHFLRLVRLLKLCMEFELTQEQIDELEEGFKSWVEDYEWYVESPAFPSID
jgi:hypothetical protein